MRREHGTRIDRTVLVKQTFWNPNTPSPTVIASPTRGDANSTSGGDGIPGDLVRAGVSTVIGLTVMPAFRESATAAPRVVNITWVPVGDIHEQVFEPDLSTPSSPVAALHHMDAASSADSLRPAESQVASLPVRSRGFWWHDLPLIPQQRLLHVNLVVNVGTMGHTAPAVGRRR